MTDERWKDDPEFKEYTIDEVKRDDNGEVLLSADGLWLWIGKPDFTVEAGQRVRYYGRGLGFPVRGVVIDGRVARYQSHEELEAEQAKRSAEFKAQTEAQEAAARAVGHDELAMRESIAPTPKTIEELTAAIDALVEGPHDYGSCVYAVSLSAVAAYNYAANKLGITGFQAGCADMDIIRRVKHLDGPFGLIRGEDMLYPQSDPRAKLSEWLGKWQEWAAGEARKKLDAEKDNPHVHPGVRAHWEALAGHKAATA